LASIGLLRVRVRLLPLLLGRLSAQPLTASEVRLHLRRAADGQVNWRARPLSMASTSRRTRAQQDFSGLNVHDAQVSYQDDKQKRSFQVVAEIDPRTGVTIRGSGLVDGATVRVQANGGPLLSGKAWPFSARLAGPQLRMAAVGSMAAPLTMNKMNFDVTAEADDLKRIDRIIEAGLFGTQPVSLQAKVARDGQSWHVDGLRGRIGGSPVDGYIHTHKEDGRTKLEGRVHFSALDFDDLASNAGHAKALALEQAEGLKLVPNTRINIRKIRRTDGHIAFVADRIVGGRRPSSIKDAQGTLDLEDRILTVSDLRLGLDKGAIVGRAVVDQRDDAPHPAVTLDLDLKDSTLSAIAGGKSADVDAKLRGRVRLRGRGDTLREAVGTSNGRIGLAATDGALPAKMAAMLGFDVGKALTADKSDVASLRCALIGLKLTNGRGAVTPLLVDTSSSQLTGSGTVSFPQETLSLRLIGAAKGKAVLQFPGTISAEGTIRAPKITLPPKSKSVGSVLRAVGHALSGDTRVVTADADCRRLAANVTHF
jgi:AsmA family protein